MYTCICRHACVHSSVPKSYFYKFKLLLFIFYYYLRSVMDPTVLCVAWMKIMISQSVCNLNM